MNTVMPSITAENALLPDHECDASEIWQEETDPEAERGEGCTALFESRLEEGWDGNPFHEFYVTVFTLIGITIDDGHGEKTYPRERAIELLGIEAVERLEEAAFESEN